MTNTSRTEQLEARLQAFTDAADALRYTCAECTFSGTPPHDQCPACSVRDAIATLEHAAELTRRQLRFLS